MAPTTKSKGKKAVKEAPLPSIAKKAKAASTKAAAGPKKDFYLRREQKKHHIIGMDIQPKRNLRPYVKWPKSVILQRQRAILYKRLRVPPPIHQFANVLAPKDLVPLFKLLHHCRPDSRIERQKKIVEAAKQFEAGSKKPYVSIKGEHELTFGIGEVTNKIERKEAKLVVIACDVDPIELVIWMPALCRKMQIPYCIVKSRSRLGTVCHKKKTCAIAITSVKPEDKQLLATVREICETQYNSRADDIRKTWGGNIRPSTKASSIARRRKARAS